MAWAVKNTAGQVMPRMIFNFRHAAMGAACEYLSAEPAIPVGTKLTVVNGQTGADEIAIEKISDTECKTTYLPQGEPVASGEAAAPSGPAPLPPEDEQ